MPVQVGISGFGCLGRLLFRAACSNPDTQVKAVNDPFMDLQYMVYQLKRDSAHEKFPDTISCKEVDGKEFLMVNDIEVEVFHEKGLSSIPWAATGSEYVCESTGAFAAKETTELHLNKVIMSVSPMVIAPIYLMEVDRKDEVSSGTADCLVPPTRGIQDKWGWLQSLETAAHSVFATQWAWATVIPSLHGGRCSSQNIIPSFTATTETMCSAVPSVNGRLTGMAFHAPTPDVSVVDLPESPDDYEEILAAIEVYIGRDMKGVLHSTSGKVVSRDSTTCKNIASSSAMGGEELASMNGELMGMAFPVHGVAPIQYDLEEEQWHMWNMWTSPSVVGPYGICPSF